MRLLHAILITLLATSAQAASLLDINGRRPDTVLVTAADDASAPFDWIAAEFDRRRLAALRRALSGTRDDLPANASTVLWLHPTNQHGDRAVELLRAPDGQVYSRATVNGREITLRANTEALAPDLYRWLFRPRPPTELEPAKPVALTGNQLVAAPWTFDKDFLKQRVFRSMRALFGPQQRTLADESIHIRLPAGYDQSRPPGLLIWASPTDQWAMPPTLFHACDTLNLVLAGGANVGNGRNPADRFQIALDAVATAATLVELDPDRVYITGMSGGGRISSMLWSAMPDVFAGAVPIVGMNVYENVPSGESPNRSDKFWRKAYGLPAGDLLDLLRTRPLASISGPEDFNYTETQRATAILVEDGFTARFFDLPGLAHVMPMPQQFTEALEWVESARRIEPK